VEQALRVPLSTTPGAPAPGDPDFVARLEGFEDEATRPGTVQTLTDELAWWVGGVSTRRDNAAGQLGLAVVLLGCASQNASHAVGQDILAQETVASLVEAAVKNRANATVAVQEAMQMMASPQVPRVVDRVSGLGDMPQAVTPSDIRDYQQAVRDHLLVPLENAENRLLSVANRTPSPQTTLLTLQLGGKDYSFRAADFRALAAALQAFRSLLLGAVAVDPDWGSYDWDADLVDRDTDGNGMLTVAEYAPPAPFGAVRATDWVTAGECVRNAVDSLRQALDARVAADPTGLLNRALAQVGDVGKLRGYLADASNMLAGQVTVTITYETAAGRDGEAVVETLPVNLRQIWDSPPASLTGLLPPVYLFPEDVRYDFGGTRLDLWRSRVGPDAVAYDVAIDNEGGTADVVLGPQPHLLTAASAGAFPGCNLTFNGDWSQGTGTIGATSGLTGALTWGDVGPLATWDDLPDPTLSGVFPQPGLLRTLLYSDLTNFVFEYGSISFQLGD
jgi:hypothetical protein